MSAEGPDVRGDLEMSVNVIFRKDNGGNYLVTYLSLVVDVSL